LDTNVIIHLYRAQEQRILFDRFGNELYIYEQIRKIELENHAQDFLQEFDRDLSEQKINLITDVSLKDMGVYSLFQKYVAENKLLYSPKDMGEIYAISLAQTLRLLSIVTDDTKQGGPYMSLLQFPNSQVLPFTFVDILILNYMDGTLSVKDTIAAFDNVNKSSSLNWSLNSHLSRFVKRFWKDPYLEKEKKWMLQYCNSQKIDAQRKLNDLIKHIKYIKYAA